MEFIVEQLDQWIAIFLFCMAISMLFFIADSLHTSISFAADNLYQQHALYEQIKD